MASLLDLGITSLGNRLTILRAVFELKREQGVEMDDDDWRPQGKWDSLADGRSRRRPVVGFPAD